MGDWVLVELPPDGDAIVHRVLPRRSRFRASHRAQREHPKYR